MKIELNEYAEKAFTFFVACVGIVVVAYIFFTSVTEIRKSEQHTEQLKIEATLKTK